MSDVRTVYNSSESVLSHSGSCVCIHMYVCVVDGRCLSLVSARLCVDPGRPRERCCVSAPIMDLILRLTKICVLNPNPQNTFPVWWTFVPSAGIAKNRYCVTK